MIYSGIKKNCLILFLIINLELCHAKLMVTDEDTDLHHTVIFVQNIASKEVLQAVYVE